MAPCEESLTLGSSRLEKHCIHTRRHNSRSVQQKSSDHQGFRAVGHGGTLTARTKAFNLLCRATGKKAKGADSEVITSPKNTWQALSIWAKDRTNTKMIMEKTTNGLRHTKHMWVAHTERDDPSCYSDVFAHSYDFGIPQDYLPTTCRVDTQHLLHPAPPKAKSTAIVSIHTLLAIRAATHFKSTSKHIHPNFHLGHWVYLPPSSINPTPYPSLLLLYLFYFLTSS